MLQTIMKALARWLAGAGTPGGAGLLVVWAISRVASDRWLLTQYLYWIPTLTYLAGAALLLALARATVARASRPRGVEASAGRGARLRRLVAAAWVVVLAYVFFVEFRILNLLDPPSPPGALRIMHWNVSGARSAEPIIAALRAGDPDIAILADTHGPIRWRDVIEAIETVGGSRYTLWQAGILVISKEPIGQHGVQWLGLGGLAPDAPAQLGKFGPAPNKHDPGRAMFLEVHPSTFPDPLIVWIVDLPSDWRQGRYKLARHAARAIAAWPESPETGMDATGGGGRGGRGFPPPDLVVGDFNIPRGSASLALLAGSMRHGFDQAGWGWSASFPADWPLVHIDHTFSGPRLKVTRYQVRSPGPAPASKGAPAAGTQGARHRPQIAEIVWRPAGPPRQD